MLAFLLFRSFCTVNKNCRKFSQSITSQYPLRFLDRPELYLVTERTADLEVPPGDNWTREVKTQFVQVLSTTNSFLITVLSLLRLFRNSPCSR